MSGYAAELQVQLGVGADADAEELDEVSARLRQQLLELDVEAVERPLARKPPPGARAAEAAELGALIVTLAPTVLGVLVETVRSWLSRGSGRSAKLQFGDDSIELTAATSQQQERLVAAFLERHADG